MRVSDWFIVLVINIIGGKVVGDIGRIGFGFSKWQESRGRSELQRGRRRDARVGGCDHRYRSGQV